LAISLAIGACAVGQTLPTLSLSVSHNGNFLLNQTNAFYVIRVSNVGAGPTTTSVQVTDHVATGLQIASLSGPGWSCSNVTCFRSDTLAAGQSFPAIVAQGTITLNGPASITYGATVYFGGDPSAPHVATDTANAVASGYPVAWGGNQSGESLVPPGLTNVVALSGGGADSLALLANGTVVAWGDNTYGQTTVPAGLTNVLAIAAGDTHSLALTSDGTVVAWGDNTYGQTTVPAGLTGVVAIAAGHAHSLALMGDGTVVAWGANAYGQTTVPAELNNVQAISAGWWHSVALKNDGTVVAWGFHQEGESTPPPGLKNVVAIAAGAYHTLALKQDGTVAGWGADDYGVIRVPDAVVGAVAIAAGWDHCLALLADGTVVAWGYGGYGQLQIPGGLADITSVAAGGYHSLALTSAAIVSMPIIVRANAGASSSGAPGVGVDGVTFSGYGVLFNWPPGIADPVSGLCVANSFPINHNLSALSPQPGAAGVQYVFSSWSDGAIGQDYVCPRAPTTYTANFLTRYQLTTTAASPGGTVTPAPGGSYWYNAGSVASVTATPTGFSAFTGWSGACTGTGACNVTMNAPAQVTAAFKPVGGTPALALSSSHSGRFLQNQTNAVYLLRVSNGPTGASTSGAITVTETLPPGLSPAASSPVSMYGSGWTCSLTPLSCTRSDALATGQSYPAIVLVVQVDPGAAASLTNAATLYYPGTTFAATTNDTTTVDATGYPLTWGLNASGQSTLPAGLTNVVAVAGGVAHSLALKIDGTVAAWGDNSHGQTTLPSSLNNGIATVAIAAGAYHSLALQSDGTVVGWGDASHYQTTPPANVTGVVAIAAGAYHSLALRSDGTVVGWGYNQDGETSVPATLTNVVGIAAGATHSVAVTSIQSTVTSAQAFAAGGTAPTTGGAVVAWGSNALGQTNVPAGLANIVAVAAGTNHSLALSATGTVSAWGDNSYGQSAVPSSVTNIAAVAAGGNHNLALTANGAVAGWGDNTDSQDAAAGGLTNVAAIAAGVSHSLAVTSGAPGTVTITLTTAQPGIIVTADGTTVPVNVNLDWVAGSSHAIAAPTPQPGPAGTQYVFASWSDGGASSHGVAPSGATNYEATFSTQYQLATAVNNAAWGTILPASGAWYDAGNQVSVSATANLGYMFTGWSGACTGGTAACTLTMSAPQSVTANFGPIAPSLSIASSHTGNFYRGEPVAYYILNVTNSPSAGLTSGTVFVTDFVPAGTTLLSISGPGWSCTAASATCSRSDVLAPGASYPTIGVGVYVFPAAPLSTTNYANVGGGGTATPGTASDATTVSPQAP
jgi:alpha-tubulin suppressor-like RCC1 family protein